MDWATNLDLGDESAIGRDAIPSVLNVMHGIFPRDLEMLHDEHDHKRRRGRDTTWNKGGGSVRQLCDDKNKAVIGERMKAPGSFNGRLEETGKESN